MKFLQHLLFRLSGLKFGQEYLCLDRESFQPTLFVYLVSNRRIQHDITHSHQFIGYCPLIISILASAIPENQDNRFIQLIFSENPLGVNEIFNKKDAIAKLFLMTIKQQGFEKSSILFYEGTDGRHKFVSVFSQLIIGLQNRLFNKKPGNVFLHNNLYKQVQIAYSLPRTISLVTVKTGEFYNLFPTDLHGPLNENLYISSLRHQGKACKQVETAGKVILSTVASSLYKTVYQLGKNHMQNVKPADHFPFDKHLSGHFQLPLPKEALAYYELEVIHSFIHGIHKVFLYKIHSKVIISTESGTLAHIHNVYATRRHNKGLSGNYLLR